MSRRRPTASLPVNFPEYMLPKTNKEILEAYRDWIGPEQPGSLPRTLLDDPSQYSSHKLHNDLWDSFAGQNYGPSQFFIEKLTYLGGYILSLLAMMSAAEAEKRYMLQRQGNLVHFDRFEMRPTVLDEKGRRTAVRLINHRRTTETDAFIFSGIGFEVPMNFMMSVTGQENFKAKLETVVEAIYITWQSRTLEKIIAWGAKYWCARMMADGPKSRADFVKTMQRLNNQSFACNKNGAGLVGIESRAVSNLRDRNVLPDAAVIPATSLRHQRVDRGASRVRALEGKDVQNLNTQGLAASQNYGIAMHESRSFLHADGTKNDPTLHECVVSQMASSYPVVTHGDIANGKYTTECRTIRIIDGANHVPADLRIVDGAKACGLIGADGGPGEFATDIMDDMDAFRTHIGGGMYSNGAGVSGGVSSGIAAARHGSRFSVASATSRAPRGRGAAYAPEYSLAAIFESAGLLDAVVELLGSTDKVRALAKLDELATTIGGSSCAIVAGQTGVVGGQSAVDMKTFADEHFNSGSDDFTSRPGIDENMRTMGLPFRAGRNGPTPLAAYKSLAAAADGPKNRSVSQNVADAIEQLTHAQRSILVDGGHDADTVKFVLLCVLDNLAQTGRGVLEAKSRLGFSATPASASVVQTGDARDLLQKVPFAHKRTLEFLDNYNIPFPMIIHYMRMYVRISAGCAVFMKKGAETGVIAVDTDFAELSFEPDGVTRTVRVTAHFEIGTFIKTPKNIEFVPRVMAVDVIGGAGVALFDASNPSHVEAFAGQNAFAHHGAIHAIPGHYDEVRKLPYMDITGQMNKLIYSDQMNLDDKQYSTMRSMRKIWGFQHSDSHPLSMIRFYNPDGMYQAYHNTLAFRMSHHVWQPTAAGGSISKHVEGHDAIGIRCDSSTFRKLDRSEVFGNDMASNVAVFNTHAV